MAAVVAGALTLLGACGGNGDGPAAGDADEQDSPAENDEEMPSAARGARLVRQRGCLSCHTTDGGASVGPTWKGLAGSEVTLADGRTVTADAQYLRRAVRNPDADIVDGFPEGVMAKGIPGQRLTDAQIADIVAYLQTL